MSQPQLVWCRFFARLGPFIYFAGSPEDCEGKANGANLADGAVLQATVELGYSLVVRQAMSSAAQGCLGIQSWSQLDQAKLREAGCNCIEENMGHMEGSGCVGVALDLTFWHSFACRALLLARWDVRVSMPRAW